MFHSIYFFSQIDIYYKSSIVLDTKGVTKRQILTAETRQTHFKPLEDNTV